MADPSTSPSPDSEPPSQPIYALNHGGGIQPFVVGDGSTQNIIQAYKNNSIRIGTQPQEIDTATIINWLEQEVGIDFLARHKQLLAEITPGTGTWVLDHDTFTRWKSISNSPPSRPFLWMHGIFGSGKSMLASLIVNHLEKITQPRGNIACVYIHVEDKPSDHRLSLSQIFAELLKQLLQYRLNQPPSQSLLTLYQNRRSRGAASNFFDCFQAEARTFDNVFLVVDGLETVWKSATAVGARKRVKTAINSLLRMANIKVLATARTVSSVMGNLGIESDKQFQLAVIAQRLDIESYIEARIRDDTKLLEMIELEGRPSFKREVVKKVARGAGGMFLYAKLHMDFLSKVHILGDFKRVLRKVPVDKTHPFNISINKILDAEGVDMKMAKHVFTWLLHGKNPVTAVELQHSFAIQYSQPGERLDPNYLVLETEFVSACKGLVTREPTTKVIRLVHDSLPDELYKTPIVSPHFDLEICRQCIAYLSMPEFSRTLESGAEITSRLLEYPFLGYASRYWFTHWKQVETEPEAKTLALTFLRNTERVSSWYQAMAHDAGATPPRKITGLHAAVYLNSVTLTETLIKDAVKVNEICSCGGTALHWAAWQGNDDLVKLLLREKADPDQQDQNGNTPLHIAIMSGHVEKQSEHEKLIRRLVMAGKLLNAKNQKGQTPFHWAVKEGPYYAAKILAGRRLNLNAGGAPGWPLLREVMKYVPSPHKAGIIKTLLNNGADVNSQAATDGWTALSDAAQSGDSDVLCHLLEHGAQVDRPNGDRNPPLWLAAHYGKDRIAERLLSCKSPANVNLRGNDGSTPLIQAVKGGHKFLTSLILEQKALLPDLTDDRGHCALFYATEKDDRCMVWLLLSHGANPRVRDKDDLSILDMAAQRGMASLVWLILCENGGEGNAQEGSKGFTALHHAVLSGHKKVVEVLALHGVDIDQQSSDKGITALMIAAENRKEDIMQVLIQHGASCSVQDKKGNTVLHRAVAASNDSKLTRLDMVWKAVGSKNVDVLDAQEKTPLMLAAARGRVKVVDFLLHNGADVKRRDVHGLTALQHVEKGKAGGAILKLLRTANM